MTKTKELSATQAYKEDIVLPTYPVGPANLNPIISTYRFEKPYPYKMYDALEDNKKEVTYETLVIENEYLKVSVLPKLGAKLYSALDKRNGQQVFYHNRTVRPQLVGLTGAWTSGGIEFNFPRAHRPSSMEEINTYLRENADGSSSIFLGEIDKSTGLRFTVELKLEPGKAYIEQIIRIYNATSLPQRFYFWNTSSYPETPDMEFRYPAKWLVEEFQRKRTPWPYDGGVDLRHVRNIKRLSAFFVSNNEEDYFGVYDPTLERGTVHVANHVESPGKKVWAWGDADLGKMWNKILTETDGPYVEYQSGNVYTQADYVFMQPYQNHNWKEYWFQAIRTGPFTFASKHAIVTTRFERGTGDELQLHFTLAANETLNKAAIEIIHSGNTVHKAGGDWNPGAPVKINIPLNYKVLSEGTLRARLVSESGNILFDYVIRKNKSAIDEIDAIPEIHKDDDVTTLFSRIHRAESRTQYREALALVNELLESHPHYIEAQIRKAVILVKMLDYQGAKKVMDQAVAQHPMSPEARFYAGFVEFLLGNLNQARFMLLEINDISMLSPQACILLGKIALREEEYLRAQQYFEKALAAKERSTSAEVLLAYTLRKLNRPEQAKAILNQAIAVDPLNLLAVTELDWLDAYDSRSHLIRSNIHDLLHAVQFYQEIADWYAVERLLTTYSDSNDPLVLIHLGSLESRKGRKEQAKALFAAAEKQSLNYVFPTLPITLQALYSAIDSLGDAAVHMRYYAGLIYHAAERSNEAEQLWKECVQLGIDYSVAYRNLGYTLMRKGNKEEAIEVLELGLYKLPANSDIVMYLDVLYKEKGLIDKRKKLIPDHVDPTTLDETLCRILICINNDLGQYGKAISLMSKYKFRAWEIEENINLNLKRLYHEAWLGLAREHMAKQQWDEAIQKIESSMTYPENTQLARSAEQLDIRALYMLAVCNEKKGCFVKALEYCDQIAIHRLTEEHPEYHDYLKALQMKVSLEWLGF